MLRFLSKFSAIFFITAITYFVTYRYYPEWAETLQYEFESGHQPDAFEYYMPAANLALHNKFPYYGFISSMDDYQLNSKPESIKYFADTYKAGSMVFVSKPPLYSLLLGLSFKLFGFKPFIAIVFNFVCLVVIVFCMLLLGYLIKKWLGLLIALISILLWFIVSVPIVYHCDAEMLTKAFAMLFLLISIFSFRQKKNSFFFLLGLTAALLLLTKGIFLFSFLFTGIWLFVVFLKVKTTQKLKQIIFYLIGLFIPLFIWMLYINPLLKRDIPNRLVFADKLEATTPQILVEKREQLFDSNGVLRKDVIENLNKFHQYQHARENSFVFISNQNGKYNILNVHNEFCTDGDFHPEWRIIKTSFYQSYLNDPNIIKLSKFYSTFRLLGLKITWAKFINTGSISGFLYYISLFFLSGLFLMQKASEKLFVGYFLLVSVFMYLIILYGEIRFIDSVLPITLLLSILSIVELEKKQITDQ